MLSLSLGQYGKASDWDFLITASLLVIIYVVSNIIIFQGVTLALARSPRRVSKVSGERKSSITRPFGEYDFRCQEIIQKV